MEEKVKEILKMQLVSAAAALQSAQTALEAVFLYLEPAQEKEPAQKPCSHPKDRREDLSTMGWERWRCLDCDHVEEVKV